MRGATPWIVALLVSVLANGAMLGLTLHNMSDGPRFEGRERGASRVGVRGDGFSVRGFLSALPPDDRDAAIEQLRASRENVVERVQDVRHAQAEVEQALLQEPFDAERVRAAMADLRQARGLMESEVEAAIIDILADLPPEERLRALDEGMRPSHRRGPPRHRRGDRRPPPRDY